MAEGRGRRSEVGWLRSVFPANRLGIGYTLGVMLWIVGLFIFVLNLPLGYWRARVQRFSAQWILAIHLPVPIVVACRIYSGLGWHVTTFPVMIGAFFLGQFVGGKFEGNY